MFTSRAEFRLHLRIDNADRRLTPHGRRVGLISDAAWTDYETKQQRLDGMQTLLEKTRLTADMLTRISDGTGGHDFSRAERLSNSSAALAAGAEAPTIDTANGTAIAVPSPSLLATLGQSLAQLLKRPEIEIETLVPALRELSPEFFARANHQPPTTNHLPSEVRNELKSLETEIKYAGYLDQQQRAIDRLKKAEQRRIPDWFDYRAVSGLSREMQEKLGHVTPQTIGQASRIPGVTPAAVSLINVYIEIQSKRREQTAPL